VSLRDTAGRITAEISRTVDRIDEAAGGRLVEMLADTSRVFLAGAGRSGCAVRAFAIRLAHLGLDAHVVGETATPPLAAGDLLLVGSGSGATPTLVAIAGNAHRLIALVTIARESPIGKLADLVLTLPAPTPKLDGPDESTSIQPMGSLFEQSLLITLDAVVLELMDRLAADRDAMFGRHANLE